jgi:hypothetical protein
MRETGPIAKSLTGGQDTSVGLISQARTQLGILKNQMRLGGLAFGKRSVTLADGTVIVATSNHGIDQVAIYTPQPVAPIETTQTPEAARHFPPIAQPPFLQIVLANGMAGASAGGDDFGQLIRPLIIDGHTLTAADSLLRPLPLTYAFSPTTSAPTTGLVNNRMLVAISDNTLTLPASIDQPATWTWSSQKVATFVDTNSGGAWALGAKELKTIGAYTTPAAMGLIRMPLLFADTKCTITGNGTPGAVHITKALGLSAAGVGGDPNQTINGVEIPASGNPSAGGYVLTPGGAYDIQLTSSQATGSELAWFNVLVLTTYNLLRLDATSFAASDSEISQANMRFSASGSPGLALVGMEIRLTDFPVIASGAQTFSASIECGIADPAGNLFPVTLNFTFNVTGVD